MLDMTLLKFIQFEYLAQRYFKKGKKIYFIYYRKIENRHLKHYYLFNPKMTFDENLQLLNKHHSCIDGFYRFYTDGEFYPPEPPKPEPYKQLLLFA